MCEVLLKDAEAQDGMVIMCVRKKDKLAERHPNHLKAFQWAICERRDLISVCNAGPIWGIELKCPEAINSVLDKTKDYVQKKTTTP